MNNSNEKQRKPKTLKRDQLVENGVESSNKQEELKRSLTLEKRDSKTDVEETENLLEKILTNANMSKALKKVMKNKGAPGVDGMETEELPEHIKQHWHKIKSKLREGKYKPSPVRKVEIPKPNGGKRELGIPTALDRVIQQAISQELTKIYDPTFSENSYGFRPNKSAHQAIKKAEKYVNDGNEWVVDIDLEKFFDTVNHDKLMGKIAKKIKDKKLLKLLRGYLNSGIMANGIKATTAKGTPQGGPLSPLLGNILLDEVDKELEKRGHKFCRYADDINIYVKSQRSGERVKASIGNLIENKLKLKVNKKKSAVGKVTRRKFLGFSFYKMKGKVRIRIHGDSIKRFKNKIREITNKNKSFNIRKRINKLNEITAGWVNYFSIAQAKSKLEGIDSWIRRKLRTCIWKQWKKVKTRYKNLRKLGIPKGKAYQYANTRKGYWRISSSPFLQNVLNNKYFETLGYKSLSSRYTKLHLN